MAHKIPYILLSAFYFLLFSACDSKWDQNGYLDGMWQLTEWRDATDNVVATKADSVYYSVQLNLLKFQRASGRIYYSNFDHSGQTLTIGRTVAWPADTVCPLPELKPYGVPADGIFRVEVLNDGHMVLSSTSQGTLSFRKY